MSASQRPDNPWPDLLKAADRARVRHLLSHFWVTLSHFPDLVAREEWLLTAELTHDLRAIVLELMLALNGIQRPVATVNLNSYLSDRQRAVLERTLVAPTVDADNWIGQAVALVVIYRWYAPQLVEKFALSYPQVDEEAAWSVLRRTLPAWPAEITSE